MLYYVHGNMHSDHPVDDHELLQREREKAFFNSLWPVRLNWLQVGPPEPPPEPYQMVHTDEDGGIVYEWPLPGVGAENIEVVWREADGKIVATSRKGNRETEGGIDEETAKQADVSYVDGILKVRVPPARKPESKQILYKIKKF